MKPLVGLLQLKSLRLSYCSIQKSDRDVIWQLDSLEHLILQKDEPRDFNDFTPSTFRLKNLSSLIFYQTDGNPELFSCIAKTSLKLESLELSWCNIQDSDILNLSRLPRLKCIILYGARQITDLGILYLSNLSCLERLRVGFCKRLSPHCLEDIAKIQTLRHLDLYSFSEDATDISSLSNLVNLHTLNICDMPGLTDDALMVVAQLKSLRKLNIRCNDNYTEEGISHLAQLPYLRTLELESKVSDNILKNHGLLVKVPKWCREKLIL